MAIYHLSIKTISRAAGRSATAAAAYRTGERITDERTGDRHDYRARRGVESTRLILPDSAPDWAHDRAALWNAAEQAETRKNSTVAREFELALPGELNASERQRLAHDFARELVQRHGCAADVAIHSPGREGDLRNHHAHILLTTRRLGPDGFGEKTRELDDQKSGQVNAWRERFAQLQNERLTAAGIEARVDHRRLDRQGLQRLPGGHLGPTATAIERRTGQPSRKRLDLERAARPARDELDQTEQTIQTLSAELALRQTAVAGMAAIRARFDAEQHRVREAAARQQAMAEQQAADAEKKRQQAEVARKADRGYSR